MPPDESSVRGHHAEMNARIPSSLKWLVLKRARAADDIERLESRRGDLLTEHAEVEALLLVRRQDRESLDRVLATHEVPIDPNDIPRIRFQQVHRTYRHGETTRLIFSYLRSRSTGWSTTTEIVCFLWMKLETDDAYTSVFHTAVRHRLKHLFRAKRIDRTLGKTHHIETSWRLKQSAAEISSQRIS